MNVTRGRNPVWLVLLAVLACDGGPSGPSGSSLRLTVLGLPNGAAAAITISGPNGFNQPATATQTFSQLAAGIYTVAAAAVTVNTSEYTPSPASQTVAVGSGSGQATVFYSQSSGNLSISITGLGTASTAAVTVSGQGYQQAVPATTTLVGLNPGSYIITARDTIAAGGTPHTASPASQTVTVSLNSTANASVAYSPPSGGGTVNLRVAGMYLTQSAQTYTGSVPLVRSRDGYLRVFVVADRINTEVPAVKVRFLNGSTLLDSATIVAPKVGVPTSVDESDLTYSWNVSVPASRVQPGLSIQAEVDPAGAVPETNELDNVYPVGTPPALDIRTVPAVDLTFVPVIQPLLPGSRNRGNISEANKSQFLQMPQKMHPISAFNAVVHADYSTTTTDTLQSENANNAWGDILGELDLLRIAESSTRYYYGVAQVSYSSGVAGVAYVSTSTIGGRAALGWDKPGSASIVAAHELGHNWARNHAPCGGPQQVDIHYPQADGSIGSYGLDVATQTLRQPTVGDVMGYCDPKWIGDYTYRGVMNYLLAPNSPIMNDASQAVQPCLLVWGRIRNGELILEPAFQVNTRASLPARPGLYTLSGQADDGSSVFSLSFSPNAIADVANNQQNFAFAVPISAARASRLSSIQIVGEGKKAIRSALPPPTGGATAIQAIQARRIAAGRVAVRWDSRTHPMVMVRDPDNGQVLSLARGGDVQVSTLKSRVELVISDGVRSRVTRMRIAQ